MRFRLIHDCTSIHIQCPGFSSGWIPVLHRSRCDRWARTFRHWNISCNKNTGSCFLRHRGIGLRKTIGNFHSCITRSTATNRYWRTSTPNTCTSGIKPRTRRDPPGRNLGRATTRTSALGSGSRKQVIPQLLKSLNPKRSQFRAMSKPKHQHHWLTLRHPLNQSVERPALATTYVATHAFTRTTYCSHWAISLHRPIPRWKKLHKWETHKNCLHTVWWWCLRPVLRVNLSHQSSHQDYMCVRITHLPFGKKDQTTLNMTCNTVLFTRLSVAPSLDDHHANLVLNTDRSAY